MPNSFCEKRFTDMMIKTNLALVCHGWVLICPFLLQSVWCYVLFVNVYVWRNIIISVYNKGVIVTVWSVFTILCRVDACCFSPHQTSHKDLSYRYTGSYLWLYGLDVNQYRAAILINVFELNYVSVSLSGKGQQWPNVRVLQRADCALMLFL